MIGIPIQRFNQNPTMGSPYTSGMTITLVATDAAGNTNSCSFVISNESDSLAPVYTCPTDMDLDYGENLPDYTSRLSVSDDCDPSPRLAQNPEPGTSITQDTRVTLTATDSSGNSAQCSFLAQITQDTTKPTLVCLEDQRLDCSQNSLPDFRDLVTVMDDRDPEPNLVQNPAPESPITLDMFITITATDVSGNSESCSFSILPSDVDIDAGSDVSIIVGESTTLSGQGPSSGEYSWSPSQGLNNPNSISTDAQPDRTTTYTLNYLSENGLCAAVDEVTITVEDPPETLVTPRGFSPNQDGINDFWKIKGIEQYPDNSVYIYNRWGNLVFAMEDYDNAKNVFVGQANRLTGLGASTLPNGTYFYKIVIDQAHGLPETEGYIVLKR